MSLMLMYKDELKGFYKSKVMLVLWIGLPVLALWIYLLDPKTEQQVPLTVLSGLVVSSLAGTLSSIMLTVGIIHEKSRGVYPLFLIRPVKRKDILLGKFFAVYSCIVMAAMISIFMGLVVDFFTIGTISGKLIGNTVTSMVMGFSMMAISASAGILIGIISPSVLVGVILVLYGGNQVASLVMIPAILGLSKSAFIAVIPGVIFASLFLWAAIVIFNKKQF